tara:strand:+ start:461 stop:1186 length:726 start_codon:yes stop_codon:yes gene_type:complete
MQVQQQAISVMRVLTMGLLFGLGACAAALPPEPNAEVPDVTLLSANDAVHNFVAVIEAVEPVAETMCREKDPTLNCDFLIVVDATPDAPANAFQTLDDDGRPVVALTVPLIAQARNREELAFIVSHEAAHHILGHIAQQNETAMTGAYILGSLASILSGGSEEQVRKGAELGAQIGARTYSKSFELQADALGAVIAQRAGFDPLKGAAFFFRIPDPERSLLGSHPANAERFATVQRAVAQM